MPFGFGRKSERPDLIEVTLVDATSGRRFASTELPVDQLPETFELSTTMHIGEDDWRVERADPIDRAGYVASGRLTLVLRKADKIDPSKILFSLPTLEDALPPMREPDSSSAYEIHEDDWRQREFVSRQFTPEIDAELVEIRRVWAERDGPGFKRAYVRAKVRAPLRDVGLTLVDVREALGGIEELQCHQGRSRIRASGPVRAPIRAPEVCGTIEHNGETPHLVFRTNRDGAHRRGPARARAGRSPRRHTSDRSSRR